MHVRPCRLPKVGTCCLMHCPIIEPPIPFVLCFQAWGWVLEMYAFTIACYMEGLPTASLHIKMMAQPPWDTKLWP